MRKIAVVTGTRAEYGYLKPLMDAIDQDPELELLPIITGMHLLDDYGASYAIVESDFPSSITIQMDLSGDTRKDMAHYLASGLSHFSTFLDENRPDILIVLGDRSESLAAALAAMYLNIPIAHINGGDVSGGTIDESIRHAITKIAHIHFVHTKQNAKRVERMGENTDNIFITGALTLDTILHIPLMDKKEVFDTYHLDPERQTFLVVQHPITTLPDYGFSQMQDLFSVLTSLQKQCIVIYPNCDAGGQRFISLLQKYDAEKQMHIIKNMPHREYLSVMKSVDLMIGNSSSGIIEAPSFKIPVINIGSRQKGRQRSANILDVKPNKTDIKNAIEYALTNKEFRKKVQSTENLFGDGHASNKIVQILKEISLDEDLIQKQITY